MNVTATIVTSTAAMTTMMTVTTKPERRENEEEDGVNDAVPNMSGTTTTDSTQPVSANPNERETT
jgi:hypothetical protein